MAFIALDVITLIIITSVTFHTLPTNLDFYLQKIWHYVTLLRFKFVIAKIRFLKAASEVL